MSTGDGGNQAGASGAAKKRRRGSRGGRNRSASGGQRPSSEARGGADDVEMPDVPSEGKVTDPKVADSSVVRRPRIGDTRPAPAAPPPQPTQQSSSGDGGGNKKKRRRGGRGRSRSRSGGGGGSTETIDADIIERRRGRTRDGRPVGRYLMCVQVRDGLTQVAVLEGRSLLEHYVSRPADDISQIHGNIYLGRVQNVLPGMEAAFVDIATPKNAV
ncbi:MAG: ribonuclease E/G, partial [Actinomycetota bacterium]